MKRIYIPLPNDAARRSLITAMLQGQASRMRGGDVEHVVRTTDGYSGSDIRALCREAAMVPIRCFTPAVQPVQLYMKGCHMYNTDCPCTCLSVVRHVHGHSKQSKKLSCSVFAAAFVTVLPLLTDKRPGPLQRAWCCHQYCFSRQDPTARA